MLIFRALQKVGTYVRAADGRERTPLHITARHGYEELVELLLHQGADPNSSDVEGHAPLFCAIQSGIPRVFKALLNVGAGNADASQSRSTLIREAVRVGQDGDVIRSLMEAGCDLLE